ncbi:hypothetical protein CEXT_190221 [Caerostris extrusa]|uniref:Uncharacterized protein n=1 Tax=Caerostris extrusa TaxID=172846 RepID=A0AAV4RI54_CAEEX|nr:hypothetical protein CEXT_190221 [Caerostris extrusa]
MFRGCQFRDPHQQPTAAAAATSALSPNNRNPTCTRRIFHHIPHPCPAPRPLPPTLLGGGGGQASGSATTPPNRRSRRRKSLLYQVLMSPLGKKSGSTNTLNTVASGNSSSNHRSGGSVSKFLTQVNV